MKNKENIFLSPGCLSMDAISRYLNDSMTMKERNGVEKHMLECGLCADAVEGYALMEDKRKAEGIISGINSEIKGVASENIFWGRRIAASVAAVIVLASGLYYLSGELDKRGTVAVNKNKLEDKAEDTLGSEKILRNAQKTEEEKTIAIQSPEKKETVNSVSKKNEYKRIEDVSSYTPASDGYFKQENEAMPEGKVNTEMNKGVSPAAAPQVSKDVPARLEERNDKLLDSDNLSLRKEEAETDQKVIEKSASNKVLNNTSAKKKKVANYQTRSAPAYRNAEGKAEKADDVSYISSGVLLYNQNKYSEAVKEFEKELKSDEKNATALYYNGLSYLALNNFDKAIKNFDKILKGMLYYEDARWNKAVALVKKGDKAEAKILLEEISQTEGIYKERAGEELKKLK